MSLCVAWIREANGTQELVFVTDSTLTGGEQWDHGIKLFEIPQTNCLLSFVGSTHRAYTLVLNLTSSIVSDRVLDSTTSIVDILNHITELFTVLVREIKPEGQDVHELRSDAKFLFGGWDWEKGAFRLWKIFYSKEFEEMSYEELTANAGTRNFVEFIGDTNSIADVEAKAKEDFLKLLECQGSLDCALDMEPAKILRDVVRDPRVWGIGGSLQIAKLHKSNKIDFFGIYWPSVEGKPHFQGREYTTINKPNVKYYDPDTFEILEMDVPECLDDISVEKYGVHMEFIHECYPDGNIKARISEKERNKIQTLLKEIAYQEFLKHNECTEQQGDVDV
ncbi:MAG: hypothetical protein K0U47_07275 [Epsilonproteobacteria bacterium]|nr:hypothetical protein [Campylobacterota bacterium]